jgi:hypothetical protein
VLAGPSRRRSRRSLASLSRTCPAPCSSSRCYDGAPRSARRVVPRQRPDSDCECYDMTSASCRDEIARCSSTRTAAEPRRAPTRVPAVSGTQLRPQRTVGGCGGKSSKPGAEPKCSVLASAGSCSGRTLFDSDRWPGGGRLWGRHEKNGRGKWQPRLLDQSAETTMAEPWQHRDAAAALQASHLTALYGAL